MGTLLANDSFFDDSSASPSHRSLPSPQTDSLCVGLIDRCQLTRECLASAAPALQPMLTILPFPSITDFLSHANLTIDLVLYYIHDTGADPTHEILMVRKAIPTRRLIIICDLTHSDRSTIAASIDNGVVAFLQPQKASLQLVVSALYLVHYERRFFLDDILTIMPPNSPLPESSGTTMGTSLTRRERSVLELIRHGQSNKDIAESLLMTTSTVKAHVRNIMQKTKASNRTQLALTAERRLRHGETHSS